MGTAARDVGASRAAGSKHFSELVAWGARIGRAVSGSFRTIRAIAVPRDDPEFAPGVV